MADWSRFEVELIVADYFSMLNHELVGKPYSKTAHRIALAPLLTNRSMGSIEFKHQNISAVLQNMGLIPIVGYKPRSNYQRDLEVVVREYSLRHKGALEIGFQLFADQQAPALQLPTSFAGFVDAPPMLQSVVMAPEVAYQTKNRPFKINYLERAQMNASLGEKGEELALLFEKWQLTQAGQINLADQVKWISREDDSAGFDILSRNPDGSDKYIEVKTTKLSKESPFYFSKNEYNFSRAKAENYHLYRVFQFGKASKMFKAHGSFESFCNIEAIQYKGSF